MVRKKVINNNTINCIKIHKKVSKHDIITCKVSNSSYFNKKYDPFCGMKENKLEEKLSQKEYE